jgi:hypothetical protein
VKGVVRRTFDSTATLSDISVQEETPLGSVLESHVMLRSVIFMSSFCYELCYALWSCYFILMRMPEEAVESSVSWESFTAEKGHAIPES